MRDLNCDNNELIMTIRTTCVNGDTDVDRSRYIVAPRPGQPFEVFIGVAGVYL